MAHRPWFKVAINTVVSSIGRVDGVISVRIIDCEGCDRIGPGQIAIIVDGGDSAAIAEAQKRKPPASAETRAKISAASKGRIQSPETIAKRTATMKEKWPTIRDAVLEKRAARPKKPVSEETRRKMSESAKARTFEDRSRTYEKHRHPSAETLARMSAASSNRSPETIAKIRAAALAQWERKRAQAIESTDPETASKLVACQDQLDGAETLIGPKVDQAPTRPGSPDSIPKPR